MAATPVVPAGRDALVRRVRLLVGATIAYNLVEAVVALGAGAAASSSALIGFGLDSLVEVGSAAAVAWQFSAADHGRREARERRALQVIAVSFFLLAAVVTADALRSLLGAAEAQPSTVGIVLAAASVVVMPVLSAAQRRAGRRLGSASAVADSRQTLLCAWLSGVLLVGLLANGLLGWSWADPLAALMIAAVAAKEGRDAWRGEGCCSSGAATLADVAVDVDVDAETAGPRDACACCAPAPAHRAGRAAGGRRRGRRRGAGASGAAPSHTTDNDCRQHAGRRAAGLLSRGRARRDGRAARRQRAAVPRRPGGGSPR